MPAETDGCGWPLRPKEPQPPLYFTCAAARCSTLLRTTRPLRPGRALRTGRVSAPHSQLTRRGAEPRTETSKWSAEYYAEHLANVSFAFLPFRCFVRLFRWFRSTDQSKLAGLPYTKRHEFAVCRSAARATSTGRWAFRFLGRARVPRAGLRAYQRSNEPLALGVRPAPPGTPHAAGPDANIRGKERPEWLRVRRSGVE